MGAACLGAEASVAAPRTPPPHLPHHLHPHPHPPLRLPRCNAARCSRHRRCSPCGLCRVGQHAQHRCSTPHQALPHACSPTNAARLPSCGFPLALDPPPPKLDRCHAHLAVPPCTPSAHPPESRPSKHPRSPPAPPSARALRKTPLVCRRLRGTTQGRPAGVGACARDLWGQAGQRACTCMSLELEPELLADRAPKGPHGVQAPALRRGARGSVALRQPTIGGCACGRHHPGHPTAPPPDRVSWWLCPAKWHCAPGTRSAPCS